MTPMIDWRKLNDAIEYYTDHGYRFISVPWIVPRDTTDITKPLERRPVSTFMGDLVGSGEQGFIQLMKEGKLPRGKYCCLTPCFRDEEVYDEIHLPYFMKVELINTGKYPFSAWHAVEDMADDALEFLNQGVYCKRIELEDRTCVEGKSIDIVTSTKSIELGSYGHRKFDDLEWVYGTGIAEPRYSYATSRDI